MTAKLPQLMTYAQVAARLGKSTRTIQRWVTSEYMDFPQPRYIRSSAYFEEAKVATWLSNTFHHSPSPSAGVNHYNRGTSRKDASA